jgi:hypothetical protein
VAQDFRKLYQTETRIRNLKSSGDKTDRKGKSVYRDRTTKCYTRRLLVSFNAVYKCRPVFEQPSVFWPLMDRRQVLVVFSSTGIDALWLVCQVRSYNLNVFINFYIQRTFFLNETHHSLPRNWFTPPEAVPRDCTRHKATMEEIYKFISFMVYFTTIFQ